MHDWAAYPAVDLDDLGDALHGACSVRDRVKGKLGPQHAWIAEPKLLQRPQILINLHRRLKPGRKLVLNTASESDRYR